MEETEDKVQIEINIPDEVYELIVQEAEARGMTVNDVIVERIEAYLRWLEAEEAARNDQDQDQAPA